MNEVDLASLGEDHRKVRHYFVDEAGDPVLFNRRKEIVVGRGASQHFILGTLDVPDPHALASELTELRLSLLADPYFAGVPSLDPSRGRTAVALHAKDDPPEVRRQVFATLIRHPLKFYAIVRDKHEVVSEVRRRNARDPGYRYSPNDLYDRMVSRLFKDRLHKREQFRAVFARRGSTDRTGALRKALQTARDRFESQWGIVNDTPIEVLASTPKQTVCLQAVDYFLWALQRRFERAESRYLDYVWPKVGLVVAADSGEAPYGTYYTRNRPVPPPDEKEKRQRV